MTTPMKLPNIYLDVDNIQSQSNICFVPIITRTPTTSHIDSFLWQGIIDKRVSVEERASGYQVKSITVTNHSDTKFLGHRGNILRGGGQNRHLLHSFILPPSTATEALVQCIQKGRWNPNREQKFYTKGAETTLPSLRFYRKSQKQIWDSIYQTTYNTNTISASQDFTVFRDYLMGTPEEQQQAAQEMENNQDQNIQTDIHQKLEHLPPVYENQIGILIVSVAPSCRYHIELYNSTNLYNSVHLDILSSFILDNISNTQQAKSLPTIDQEVFSQLQTSIEKAEWQEQKSIGEEQRFNLPLSSTAFGEAILHEDQLIHFMYASDSLEVPKSHRIGGYDILEKLGKGSSGEVFLAQKQGSDRKVAIKLLKQRRYQYERFIREYKVQAKMRHHNIVNIINMGYCDQKKHAYLVMEYVEGTNLEIKLSQSGAMGESAALRIVRDIACALELARKYKIIHRDIKPGNIMLVKNGCKLMDFGLGKFEGQEGGTITGQFMGTVYYSAPEQIRSAKEVTHLADIYSLGATLYHILCGHPPYFEHGTGFDLLKSKLENDPTPVEKVDAKISISKDVAQIVAKAISLDPKDRFQTATEMITAIDAVVDKKSQPPMNKGTKVDGNIANYQLLRQWSKDSDGETFLVRELKSSKLFIMKKISYAKDDERDAFLADMKNVFIDSGLMEVVDYGCAGNELYVVMKYVYGYSMKTVVVSTAISIKNSLKIVSILIDTLQRMKKRDFYCKYINIKNIWGDRNTRKVLLRVVPFENIATKNSQVDPNITCYMSPEFINGEVEIEKSNVYSLGATLYHMVTGKLPYKNLQGQNLIQAILDKDYSPTPVREINPAIHNEVADIISLAMAKDLDQRISLKTMQQMISEIAPHYDVSLKQ